MIAKDTFLVSFDIRDYVHNSYIKFCEPMDLAYNTEELNPYLRIPNMGLNVNHLHCRRAIKYIKKNLGVEHAPIILKDFIRIPNPKNNHKTIIL